MDCFNMNCPIRINGSSSMYICEYVECLNRFNEQMIVLDEKEGADNV